MTANSRVEVSIPGLGDVIKGPGGGTAQVSGNGIAIDGGGAAPSIKPSTPGSTADVPAENASPRIDSDFSSLSVEERQNFFDNADAKTKRQIMKDHGDAVREMREAAKAKNSAPATTSTSEPARRTGGASAKVSEIESLIDAANNELANTKPQQSAQAKKTAQSTPAAIPSAMPAKTEEPKLGSVIGTPRPPQTNEATSEPEIPSAPTKVDQAAYDKALVNKGFAERKKLAFDEMSSSGKTIRSFTTGRRKQSGQSKDISGRSNFGKNKGKRFGAKSINKRSGSTRADAFAEKKKAQEKRDFFTGRKIDREISELQHVSGRNAQELVVDANFMHLQKDAANKAIKDNVSQIYEDMYDNEGVTAFKNVASRVLVHIHPELLDREVSQDEWMMFVAEVRAWMDEAGNYDDMDKYVLIDGCQNAIPQWMLSYSMYDAGMYDAAELDANEMEERFANDEEVISMINNLIGTRNGAAVMARTAEYEQKLRDTMAMAAEPINQAYQDMEDSLSGVTTSAHRNRMRANRNAIENNPMIFGYKNDVDQTPKKNGKYSTSEQTDALIKKNWEEFYKKAKRPDGTPYFDKHNKDHVRLIKMLIVHHLGIEAGSDGKYFGKDESIYLTPQQLQFGMHEILESINTVNNGAKPSPLTMSAWEVEQMRLSSVRNSSKSKGKKASGSRHYRDSTRSFCAPIEMYQGVSEIFDIPVDELISYEAGLFDYVDSTFHIGERMLPQKRDWIRACIEHNQDVGGPESMNETAYGIDASDMISQAIDTFGLSNPVPEIIRESDPRIAKEMEERKQKQLKKMKGKLSNGTGIADWILMPFTVGRIALDPLLGISAVGEHGMANLMAYAWDSKLYQIGADSTWAPTSETFSILDNDDFVDAYGIAMELARLYPGAINDFHTWGEVNGRLENLYSERNFREFMDLLRTNPNKASRGKIKRASDSMLEQMNKISRIMFEADWRIFQRQDMKRFVRKMCSNASSTGNDVLSPSNIELMFSKGDPAQMMTAVMKQSEARDAIYRQGDYYNARMSTNRMIVDHFFQTHKGARVLFLGVEAFPGYCVAALENTFPFMNSINYLYAVARYSAAEYAGDEVKLNDLRSVLEYTRGFSHFTEAQQNNFTAGFIEALKGDVASLGTNIAKMSFLMLVFMSLGIRGGGDDDKDKMPWEYVMDLPWGQVPLKMNWFMDDIMQWSYYGAAALAAFANGKVSFENAMAAFWNGAMDSTQWGNLVSAVHEAPAFFDGMRKALAQQDRNAFGYMFMDYSLGMLAKSDNLFLSRIWNSGHYSEFAYDYRRNADGTYRAEYGDGDNMETLWNKYACKSYGCDLIGNFFGVFTGWKLGRENTFRQTRGDEKLEDLANLNSLATFSEAMREQGITDEVRGVFDRLGFDDSTELTDEVLKTIWTEYKLEQIEKYSLDHNGDLSNIATDGDLLFTKSDIKMLQNSYKSKIDDLYDELDQIAKLRAANAISYTTAKEAQNSLFADINELSDKMHDLSYGALTYTGDVYFERNGTMIQNTKGEWYNYGDEKAMSDWLPVFSPAVTTYGDSVLSGTRGNTNTKVGTNLETNRWNVDTSDINSDNIADMETAGSRNYVVNKENLQYQALKDDLADWEKEWAEKKAELKEKISSSGSGTPSSYGGGGTRYYSSYSGGGGGSSYAPSIRSYPSRVNTSKPSTMYSKTPYSITAKHLNPTVYTTGSRNAYSKREG